MKRTQFLRAGSAALFGLWCGSALADDNSSAEQAQAFVQKAVAYIKAYGSDKAYQAFTNGKAFKDRELYIFVFDMSGKCLAHGTNAKLVGKDLIGLKDPDGNL